MHAGTPVVWLPANRESDAVAADEWSEAKAAHERADYATEMRLYRQLSDQGNARAQTYLGVMYEKGRGVPQDFAEALKWFRVAADNGATPRPRSYMLPT